MDTFKSNTLNNETGVPHHTIFRTQFIIYINDYSPATKHFRMIKNHPRKRRRSLCSNKFGNGSNNN